MSSSASAVHSSSPSSTTAASSPACSRASTPNQPSPGRNRAGHVVFLRPDHLQDDIRDLRDGRGLNFGWTGHVTAPREYGGMHCRAACASRPGQTAHPRWRRGRRGATARRPPVPVEAGRPLRADSQFPAHPMGIRASLVSGADLVKFPRQFCTGRTGGDMLPAAPPGGGDRFAAWGNHLGHDIGQDSIRLPLRQTC